MCEFWFYWIWRNDAAEILVWVVVTLHTLHKFLACHWHTESVGTLQQAQWNAGRMLLCCVHGQVSCGGCHTLVIAWPRPESDTTPQNGDGVLESAEETTSSEKLSAVSEMIRRGELSNSLDMSGSISARIRRRQKMPVIMFVLLSIDY